MPHQFQSYKYSIFKKKTYHSISLFFILLLFRKKHRFAHFLKLMNFTAQIVFAELFFNNNYTQKSI